MINVNNISKSYGDKAVLDSISMVINRGDRIGLIGSNGVGKSTLLKVIAGIEKPDKGEISLPHRDFSIGYVPQFVDNQLDMSLREFLVSPEFQKAETNLRDLEEKMSVEPSEDLLTQYGEVTERFKRLGGYGLRDKVSRTLLHLGVNIPLDSRLSSLSGGQKARAALVKELSRKPDLLLLDEPTNHLDFTGLIWLESLVKAFRGAIVMISHDRTFLDKTVLEIAEIDEYEHNIREYKGNYSYFVKEREKEIEKAWKEYQGNADERKRLEESIRKKKQWAQKGQKGGKKKDNEKFDRGHAKDRSAGVAGTSKALEKRLERLQEMKKPRGKESIRTRFNPRTRSGNIVVSLEKVSKDFGKKKVLKDIDMLVTFGRRIALIGANGSGKTTLLKVIMGFLKEDSGTVKIGTNVTFGYLAQEQENLDFEKTVLEEFVKEASMTEGEARTFLHKLLFTKDEVFEKISSLSPGERARLSLAKIMIKEPNLLILDEPTNHMDISSMEIMEEAIAEFNGTVLTISHDRYFMNRIGITDIFLIENGYIRQLAEGLGEYETNLLKDAT